MVVNCVLQEAILPVHFVLKGVLQEWYDLEEEESREVGVVLWLFVRHILFGFMGLL
jgi:hypothetical protein